jgi:hypothetical protein
MTRRILISGPPSAGAGSGPGTYSPTRLWISLVALSLLTCFLINAASGEGPSTDIAPAFQIDLRSIVKGPLLFEPWGSPEGRLGTPIRSLCFLDNERLAVTVVTQSAGGAELATRGEPNARSAFRLNAVIIEASSGKVLSTPAWPSNSRFAGIVAVNGKGLVMETGEQLALFSPDLVPVKTVTLPPLPANQLTGYWSPHTSWSGRRVLLFAGPAWTKIRWLWLDAENLEVLQSWDDVVTGPVSVSDSQIVREPFSQHVGDPPSALEVGVPGGDWKPIPSTLGARTPHFIGPDLLYFHRAQTINHPAPAEAFLIRTDGSQILRLETAHSGWGPGRSAVSRLGDRFVVLLTELKGSHPALDISGHTVVRGLLVYDRPFRVTSHTLVVRDSRVRDVSAALSPDGRHLALLGYPDPVLEIFAVPPSN